MTALVGGPGQHTQTQIPPAQAGGIVAVDVPVLAPGTQLLGTAQGSGYVTPPALVRRGDGQVLQLTPLLYAVLEAVDGTRDADAVAAAASEATGRGMAADDVMTLNSNSIKKLNKTY